MFLVGNRFVSVLKMSVITSILDCAQQETSEEARLTGGRWISLMPEGHPGIGEVTTIWLLHLLVTTRLTLTPPVKMEQKPIHSLPSP